MAYEKQYKLGEGMLPEDNILLPISFTDIILSVKCDCKDITPDAVRREYKKFLEMRLEDAEEILSENLYEIIDAVKKQEMNNLF